MEGQQRALAIFKGPIQLPLDSQTWPSRRYPGINEVVMGEQPGLS